MGIGSRVVNFIFEVPISLELASSAFYDIGKYRRVLKKIVITLEFVTTYPTLINLQGFIHVYVL